MQEIKDRDGKIHHILTTAEMMEKTGKSPRTLVRWAGKGIPGANWDSYSHSWDWDEQVYDEWMRSPRKKPQPHAGQNGARRRGRKGQFSVVK